MHVLAAASSTPSYGAWAYLAVFALMALSFAEIPATAGVVNDRPSGVGRVRPLCAVTKYSCITAAAAYPANGMCRSAAGRPYPRWQCQRGYMSAAYVRWSVYGLEFSRPGSRGCRSALPPQGQRRQR